MNWTKSLARRVGAVPCALALFLCGCQTLDLSPNGTGTKPLATALAEEPAGARVAPLPRQVQFVPPPALTSGDSGRGLPPPLPSLTPAPHSEIIGQSPLLAPPPVVGPTTEDPLALPAPMPAVVPRDKDDVRAALLVPLSGPNAVLGQALSNAAQLALFDQADASFNLIPLDSKGTAEGAVAALKQAQMQGADIILGPLFSAEVKAVTPLVREMGIPLLSFTTDKSAVGNGVYTLGTLPNSQMSRVVSYARSQGKDRFAVLARNDEYGRAMAEAARDAVAQAGGRMVKVDFYDLQSSDQLNAIVKRFTDVDARMRGRTKETETPVPPPPFDAVILPDDGVRLRTVASLISYHQVDPDQTRFLGTMLWDNNRLSAEPSLQGGWYPAPATEARQLFEYRYQTAFKSTPPAIVSLAYDSTALAALVAQKHKGDFSTEALTNPQGFAGVDGIFRLFPDGTSERGLAVREISKGGNRDVSPAPQAFAK